MSDESDNSNENPSDSDDLLDAAEQSIRDALEEGGLDASTFDASPAEQPGESEEDGEGAGEGFPDLPRPSEASEVEDDEEELDSDEEEEQQVDAQPESLSESSVEESGEALVDDEAQEENAEEEAEEPDPAKSEEAEAGEEREEPDQQQHKEAETRAADRPAEDQPAEELPGAAEHSQEQPVGQRVGEVLSGRYELTSFIERGAMGEVYEAEHSLMRKTVAVKILHSNVTGKGKIVERFRREAQAAANIDHPNVCVATDFGRTSSGDFFLVMEFLEGRTLQERIDEEGPFETQRALHIANQICSALVRAHAVGVVHRDLKPDNIMLVERGDDPDFVKILDFGIARVRMDDQTPELTQTGAVFGTPSYMSPEQAAGDPVDHRTDLYALGNVIYQMLTGRRVFEADRGAQVMAMHVSKEPEPPSKHAPRILDRSLETLLLDLLAKDPDDRPQTAVELQEELLELSDVDAEWVDGSGLAISSQVEATDRTDDGSDPSRIVTRALDGTSGWFKRHGATSRWAALGLVGILGAMSVTLVVAILSGGVTTNKRTQAQAIESKPLSLTEARRKFMERRGVRVAMNEFVRGAYAAAIRQLETIEGGEEGENPHLAYLLGRAHAEAENFKESLSYFDRALSRESRYIRDRHLLEDVVDALGSREDDVVEAARKLLTPRLDNEFVLETLGRTAWRDPSIRTRKRTLSLLEKQKVLKKLPEWTRQSIELRHSHGCKEHRRNIEGLEELEDPRGLEVLRLYQGFPKRGCGEYENRDCFGCVRDDIADAIETLREIEEADG